MAQRTVINKGTTAIARNGGDVMYHKETTTIAARQVRIDLEGLGPDCEEVDPVVSEDPAVVAHHREIDEARQKSAYQNRPITPIFKTQRSRRGKR
jgi:hypothetical protein